MVCLSASLLVCEPYDRSKAERETPELAAKEQLLAHIMQLRLDFACWNTSVPLQFYVDSCSAGS